MTRTATEQDASNPVSSWLKFAHMLKDLQGLAKDLELSNFSLCYGVASEKDFRAKMKQIETLVGKMLEVIGPEPVEINKTLVS